MKVLLQYFSVGGNTAKVANIISEEIKSKGADVESANIRFRVVDPKDFDLVGIGFPVWEFKPPRPIIDYLKRMDWSGKKVFLFLTYGSVWPGDAADRAIKIIRQRGGKVVGVLIVPVTHAYSFFLKRKIVRELTDEDVKVVRDFAARVIESDKDFKGVHGFTTKFFAAFVSPFATPGFMPKVKVDKNKCNGCGSCAQVCPAGAIKIVEDGYPMINSKICFRCYTCIKSCPEGALNTNKRLVETIVHLFRKVARDKGVIRVFL